MSGINNEIPDLITFAKVVEEILRFVSSFLFHPFVVSFRSLRIDFKLSLTHTHTHRLAFVRYAVQSLFVGKSGKSTDTQARSQRTCARFASALSVRWPSTQESWRSTASNQVNGSGSRRD